MRADARITSRAATYLASSVVATLISFVTLPLATRILGPANYGVFALGATVAGFGSTLATLGTTFYISNTFAGAGLPERRQLISTLVARTALLAAVWAVLILGVAWILRGDVALLDEVPLRGLALVLLGAILATPWTIAVDVLTVEGKASWFSISLIVHAFANAVVLLVSLYAFDLRGLSLFVGSLAGSAAMMVTSLIVLRRYLAPRLGLARSVLGQRKFLPAQALEAVQPVVERTLLANYTGFTQLGNYAHSLSYRSLITQSMNAVNRATWPVTLAEAKERATFAVTGRVWAATQLGVAMVAVPFVLFGDRLISMLTNDKLTAAWVFLAPWFVLVLLQSSGKAATGVLYATGVASTVAKLGLLANGVAIGSVVVLVPMFGAAGAATALLLQALVFRIALQILARRRVAIPFQDWGAVLACALVTGLFVLRRHVVESTESLLVLLVAVELVCVVVGGKVIVTVAPLLLKARARSA
jgi:O-antigen/teichoic acid export membrane protein